MLCRLFRPPLLSNHYPITGFTGSIITNTVGGDDILTVDFSGSNPIQTSGLTFNGGTQTTSPNGDKLVLTGGTFTNTTYTYTNENDGSINLDDKVITYTGLEPIAATVTAANVILNYSPTAETITVSDASCTQTTVDSTAGETTTFNNPTGSLTVDGGATGANTFNLNSISSGFAADLSINGSGYTSGDVVNLNADPHSNDFTIDNVQNINVATGIALTTTDTPDQGDVNWTAGQSIVFNNGSSLTTTTGNTTGNINLLAKGGLTTVNSRGISVNSASVTSTDGTISLTGTGSGTGAGTDNYGVGILSTGNISSLNGAISVTGTGGSGTNNNRGVLLSGGVAISSTGTATITVQGQGSTTATGTDNYGVGILSASNISSLNGAIFVTGTGGSGTNNNRGVSLSDGSTISSTGTATITVQGQGSTTATGTDNYGVGIINGSQIRSLNGAIFVTGTGGSGTNNNRGVSLSSSTSAISSTGTAAINVTGQGSTTATGTENYGILLSSTQINSVNGSITISGTGGNGSDSNSGLRLVFGGSIVSTGNGSIAVTGGGGSGTNSDGIRIEYTGGRIQSNSGAINLAGIATGNNFGINLGGTITSTTGNINLLSSTINLASDTASITTAGNVFINQDNDTPVGTTTLGATVNVTAGNLYLNDTIKVDYNTGLNRFDTLNLTGAVDLGGSTLNLDTTNYNPVANGIYTLINNDGSDAVIGTFNGLAEGGIVSTLGNYNLLITYQGNAANPTLANIGTGNDVQLYVNQAPTAVSAPNASLAENTNTTNRVQVADITVTDDGIGTNNLSLSGADASSFEIIGTELYVKANTILNYEAKSSYNFIVNVDDSSVGNTPDAFTNFTLTLNDINEIFGDNNSNEKLVGTNNPDWIDGRAGNDILEGAIGNDTLIGGAGTDTAEYKNATAGTTINLTTGIGLDGQGGTDTLIQIENVNGSNSNDLLTGNDQTNVLDGRSGNDTLNGCGGIDILIGGAGNNALNGGTGIDTADYSRASNGVTVNLFTGTASNNGYSGIDTLTGIEMVYGSKTAGDSLTGDANNNSLYGYGGADTLTGGGGNDSLYMGVDAVTDTVNYNSGDGSDTVFNFVRGVNRDRLNFTGIANIDVRVSGTSTQFRVGDGTIGNTGFGTGTLLLTTSATTGFVAGDVSSNLFGATFAFS